MKPTGKESSKGSSSRKTLSKVKKKIEPCWISRTKIPAQNLVTRIFHREIHKYPRRHLSQIRSFYQNITPNFTITNVYKPPCFLRKFSPDGK